MAIIPWRELASADSPFVTVFELAGIKVGGSLINFVVLTSAASALNSTLYSTGRHLYQIAHDSPNPFLKAIKADTLSRHKCATKCHHCFSNLDCSSSLYQYLARCLRCLCLDYGIFFWCLHCYLHFDHACPS